MKNFLSHVENITKKRKVKFSLVNQPTVITGGVHCSGFFDGGKEPELTVAIGKDEKEWMEILVHEFGHMNQWIENAKVWTNLNIEDTTQIGLFDLWLGHHIELNKEQLKKCISSIIELELDCEKRAVSLIKEFNLNINAERYIQKANSYILFYHLVKNKRLWSKPGKAPYMISQLVDSMPNHFVLDYSNPTPQILGLIEKNVYRF